MPARHNVIIANQIITGSGADAAGRPSISFGDKDTGFYESTDDKLHVTLGGTERFVFSGSEFVKADGSAGVATTIANESIMNSHVSGSAAIVLNKLASGTQGNVLIYDSAGKVSGSATGTGTTGQLLTSNGAGANPSWQNAPAGSDANIKQVSISGAGFDAGIAETVFTKSFSANQMHAFSSISFIGQARRRDNQASDIMFDIDTGTVSGQAKLNLGTNNNRDITMSCAADTQNSDSARIAINDHGAATALSSLTLATGWISGAWTFRVKVSGQCWIMGQLFWVEQN